MLFNLIDGMFLFLASVITGSAFRPKAERSIPRRVALPNHAHQAVVFEFEKARVRFVAGHLYLLENHQGNLVATREKKAVSIALGRYASPEEAAEVLYTEYFTPEPLPRDQNFRLGRVIAARQA